MRLEQVGWAEGRGIECGGQVWVDRDWGQMMARERERPGLCPDQKMLRRLNPGPFLGTGKRDENRFLCGHILDSILRPTQGGLKWLKVA